MNVILDRLSGYSNVLNHI